MSDTSPPEPSRAEGEGSTAATNGPIERGTAVGRPVEPRHAEAAQFPIYSGSSRLSCLGCGRPTWFGPRLRELIAGGALYACADCLIDRLKGGYDVPKQVVSLGNPEVPASGR